jgi:hypothetical protein
MSNLRYDPAVSSRDLRLDLLRGVCLVKMVLNHLPHAWLQVLNHGFGFVSGAEGFFFISGAVVGIVYRRRMEELGWRAASRGLVERSAHLYVANLGLVLFFLTLELTDTVHWRFFGHHWPNGLDWPMVFTFDQPYFLHVLPRYVVFVAASSLALWLLRRGRTDVLLGVGVALHGWRYLGGSDVHVPFVEGDQALFPILAWQLLFLVGLVLGFHRQRVAGWYRRYVAGGWAGFLLGIVYGIFFLLRLALLHGYLPPYPGLMELLDRDTLGYLRWVNLAATFTFLYWVTDRYWTAIARWFGGFLLPVGQNALYVFLVHIPLAWCARQLVKPYLAAQLPDGALTAAIFVFDVLIVALLWWMVRRRFLFRLIPR